LSDLFATYAEALGTLGSVEARQRDALRKAVESAATAEAKAKQQLSDQQRMYDRAGRDAQAAERRLAQLRSLLGVAASPLVAAAAHDGEPPSLAQIRGQVRDVEQWAEEARRTAESLLRTRERLAKAPKPAPPPAAPVPSSPPARSGPPVGSIAAVVVLVAIAILVVLVAL